MKRSYLYLIIAAVLILILIVYHQLGGFNEISVERKEPFQYHLAGKKFHGKISSKEWEDLFYKTREFIDENTLKGDLCIVWLKQPDEKEGIGTAFVGVDLEKDQKFPGSLDTIDMNINGILRVELKGHVLVLPQPEQVIDKMNAYSLENDLILQDIVIDRYLHDGRVYTEIPY